MSELTLIKNEIPAMSEVAIDSVRQLEAFNLKFPQLDMPTLHIIHGGMYARTIVIPPGVTLTGALIKVATTLTICGNVVVYIGDKSVEYDGYNVLPAAANRKQAFVAKTKTYLTMTFRTDAQTVKEAEEQFTDEAHLLMSRKNDFFNHVIVTGE